MTTAGPTSPTVRMGSINSTLANNEPFTTKTPRATIFPRNHYDWFRSGQKSKRVWAHGAEP